MKPHLQEHFLRHVVPFLYLLRQRHHHISSGWVLRDKTLSCEKYSVIEKTQPLYKRFVEVTVNKVMTVSLLSLVIRC